MMTMPPWLARPLRRFAGTAAMMVFGGQAFVYGVLHPGPEMPPRDADQVFASTPDGRTIQSTDRATIERLVAFVRARDDLLIRIPKARDHFWQTRTMCFQRGVDGSGCVRFNAESMIIHAKHDILIYRLTPADAARLERLLAAGVVVSQR